MSIRDDLCWSRGPRIGGDGHPYCLKALGHSGSHESHPDSGFTESWGDPLCRASAAERETAWMPSAAPELTERAEIEALALEVGWAIERLGDITEFGADDYRFTVEFVDDVTVRASLAKSDGSVLLTRESGHCCLSVGEWLRSQLQRWRIAYDLGDRLRGAL